MTSGVTTIGVIPSCLKLSVVYHASSFSFCFPVHGDCFVPSLHSIFVFCLDTKKKQKKSRRIKCSLARPLATPTLIRLCLPHILFQLAPIAKIVKISFFINFFTFRLLNRGYFNFILISFWFTKPFISNQYMLEKATRPDGNNWQINSFSV